MSTRYRADPDAVAAMMRDGIGWGHNIQGGSLNGLSVEKLKPSYGIVTRLKGLYNGAP